MKIMRRTSIIWWIIYRLKKVNWKRLFWAMRETIFIMLTGIIGVGLVLLPLILSIMTDNSLWFILYGLAFFILTTYEKYNGR